MYALKITLNISNGFTLYLYRLTETIYKKYRDPCTFHTCILQKFKVLKRFKFSNLLLQTLYF